MNICGTGSSLPKFTLDNHKLTTFLDTSDEWITTRTGIHSRQVITDETLKGLGLEAAGRALEDAGLEAGDIDFVLCSTVQADTVTPSLACLLQGGIGAHCGALDINGACAGFVYALDLADAMIATGRARHVLVVCAEAMTRLCDWTDRSTCVLFGDGAAAVVCGPGEGFMGARLTSEGNEGVLYMRPQPGNSPFEKSPAPYTPMYMAGQEVYKFAVSTVPKDLKAVAEQAGLTPDDIDHYILHQANKRILDAVRARLHQGDEKFPSNIAVRGNTSSASLPILLDELNRAGHFKKGDLLAMSAFGAGLTTGSCILRWTKEQSFSK